MREEDALPSALAAEARAATGALRCTEHSFDPPRSVRCGRPPQRPSTSPWRGPPPASRHPHVATSRGNLPATCSATWPALTPTAPRDLLTLPAPHGLLTPPRPHCTNTPRGVGQIPRGCTASPQPAHPPPPWRATERAERGCYRIGAQPPAHHRRRAPPQTSTTADEHHRRRELTQSSRTRSSREAHAKLTRSSREAAGRAARGDGLKSLYRLLRLEALQVLLIAVIVDSAE